MSAKQIMVWVSAVGLLVAGGGPVHAQGIGLQVADTAELRSPGEWMFTAGGAYGDDAIFYGVRETYALLESFRLFVDVGVVDLDQDEADFGMQGGALFTLPGDYISDLALRAAVYGVNADDHDVVGGNLMLLSSDETLIEGLFVYAGLGIDVAEWDTMVSATVSSEDTEVNAILAGGVIGALTDSWSVYAEVSYVESFMFGIGLRIR